jgi:hypothetical protein
MEIAIIASILGITIIAVAAIIVSQRSSKQLGELERKIASTKITLPLRLQAYERCIVFLERISPDSLVVRVGKNEETVAELQAKLLSSIRSEFEHNISQQLYVSPDAWTYLVNAKNNIVGLVNACSAKLQPNMRAIELSKLIIETYAEIDISPTIAAKQRLKHEASQLY